MSAHTPGPWVVDAGYIVGVSDAHNADTIAVFEARPSEANARLIAAAPELLDALRHAVALIEEAYKLGAGQIVPKCLRDAIAKAVQP